MAPHPADPSPHHAWLRHEATIRAVPDDAEISGKADLVFLASAAGSRAPLAERYAASILALPKFDPSWLYELSSVAGALFWLAVERRVVGEVQGSVQALLRQVAAERRRLATIAQAATTLRGLPSIAAAVAVPGKRPSDYAASLQSTVALLHRLGLEGTPLDVADLEAADALAMRLLVVSDPRQREPAEVTELQQLQRKALALLVAVYDEVRAAVLYVGRYDPDIERVMPALWSLRGKRVGRRKRAGVGRE